MADKIKVIESISHIRNISKKKASTEKILTHLSKSEAKNNTWSAEYLRELLSTMTAENQIELVDGAYKIKENKETGSNLDDDMNFVENKQIESINTVSDLVNASETIIIPETQQMPQIPPDTQVTPK